MAAASGQRGQHRDDHPPALRLSHRLHAAILYDSALLVQVPQTASTATHAETYIALDGPANNRIMMLEEEGQFYARVTTDSVDQDIGSSVYDPTQHAWWRIRESGGTLYWETAPDGVTWVVQQQLTPLPFTITDLDVEIGSLTYEAQASPGASHFASCNLRPP